MTKLIEIFHIFELKALLGVLFIQEMYSIVYNFILYWIPEIHAAPWYKSTPMCLFYTVYAKQILFTMG